MFVEMKLPNQLWLWNIHLDVEQKVIIS